ncbi:hypothetical protein ACWEPC_53525, partial [Nonomuraea sp. NPDC004297]
RALGRPRLRRRRGAHGQPSDGAAEDAQSLLTRLLAVHSVRPGVPAIKAVLDDRGLCPPHVAAPLMPCSQAERRDLIALLADEEAHLLLRR